MSRTFALVLVVILVASSLLMIRSVNAQIIPKPSVPEFSVKAFEQIEGGGLEIEIQNQPIIPNSKDSAWIFYDIQNKWHNSKEWLNRTIPNPEKGIRGYVTQTGANGTTGVVFSYSSIYELLGVSSTQQVDYRIRAINGYLNSSIMYSSPIGGVDPNSQPVIIVNTSDWSNPQTITIGESSTTPSPSVPEFPIILPLVVVLAAASLLLVMGKRKLK